MTDSEYIDLPSNDKIAYITSVINGMGFACLQSIGRHGLEALFVIADEKRCVIKQIAVNFVIDPIVPSNLTSLIESDWGWVKAERWQIEKIKSSKDEI